MKLINSQFLLPQLRRIGVIVTTLSFCACAWIGTDTLTQHYGAEIVRHRTTDHLPPGHVDFWREVKPILDKRCVVCHACYDAPCQLKLGALDGIDRGASKQVVYHQLRVRAAPPTRLFEDAQTTQEWREKDFFPVLNERQQDASTNALTGVMYQMLALKEQNPLPNTRILADDFTLGSNRDHHCPRSTEIPKYAAEHPLWGMPYALPQLSDDELSTLKNWLIQGAQRTKKIVDDQRYQESVDLWEEFLNRQDNKGQLVARYLYEHLFLAHLHFDQGQHYFRLVRSSTPPGQPVQPIASRRPFDNPGVARVYYRLVTHEETISLKTHLPYLLNEDRMAHWEELFFKTAYEVDTLPSYDSAIATNPFKTFVKIPIRSRYKFLLDEAQFSVMNFIKGPVCRGQVALNVIQDHFWIFFVDPDIPQQDVLEGVIAENLDNLALPNAEENIYFPLSTWLKYAAKRQRFYQSMNQFIASQFTADNTDGLNIIWDGDQRNPNSALTVLRHFDSASVEQGLVGPQPKTVWLLGYTLLERIHYLLAAGYDVYGNVGHQLFSRLHMDFLRMEGEANFLKLLPLDARIRERQNWYEKSHPEILNYLSNNEVGNVDQRIFAFKTDDPKSELLQLLKQYLSASTATTDKNHDLGNNMYGAYSAELTKLAQFRGGSISFLAESSILEIYRNSPDHSTFFSLFKNTGHMNVNSLLREEYYLKPQDNTVTLIPGVYSASYPNVFFHIEAKALVRFVDAVLQMQTEQDYRAILDQYAIRRTDKRFWEYSDRLNSYFKAEDPIRHGLLDYNRLENR